MNNEELYEKRLAELLVDLSYLKQDVTLSSGKKSDYYFDCKQTALNAEGCFLIGQLLFKMLPKDISAVAGMTLGADPLVTAVSYVSYTKESPVPAIIIRKEAKGHGTGAYLEGVKNIAENTRVVLLEDVVTTGGTTIIAAKRLRDAGFIVDTVLTILDREEGGAEVLKAAGLSLQSIFTRKKLFELVG